MISPWRRDLLLGLLLSLLWLPAGDSFGRSQGETRVWPRDLSGIWWAMESFDYPDGRRDRWEYVVAVQVEGDRITISDGDGMSLAGTLVNGTCLLRGSYPWSDGTAGHYTLDLSVRETNCLEAAGSWVNHDRNGQPIPGARGLVSFLFARPGERPCEEDQGWAMSVRAGRPEPLSSIQPAQDPDSR